LIFFGFLGLFATTNLVLVLLYLFGIETPLPLTNPVKILGNVSAVAAFIGCSLIILKRLTDSENTGNTTPFDWAFINVLFATVITGILSQLFRLADIAVLAYSTYFIHLVFVFFLLTYAPFSKFAHIFYRTVAIVYSKYSNRDK
jgi:quinone-modifying oxidoreductase subunit QmoC